MSRCDKAAVRAQCDRERFGCTDPPWSLIGLYLRGRLLAPVHLTAAALRFGDAYICNKNDGQQCTSTYDDLIARVDRVAAALCVRMCETGR